MQRKKDEFTSIKDASIANIADHHAIQQDATQEIVYANQECEKNFGVRSNTML